MPTKMLQLHCSGTPSEIGFQHGRDASSQIAGSIRFYAALFKAYTGKGWDDIIPIASQFEKQIRQRWPRYFEEMVGVARGSNNDELDIVALNVRTEIMFGLLSGEIHSDGCTSLAWKVRDASFLCQNWDWMEEQKENLVLMTVKAAGYPTIKMVTEAGIIGKIGLNSEGVGVCLNAIRSRGFDESRLPVHLGLRMALESTSMTEAANKLENSGMAGSAHILVADKTGSIGLEFTSSTFTRLQMNDAGQVFHTNHMLEQHDGIDELTEVDSFSRLDRLKYLLSTETNPSAYLTSKTLTSLLDDHDGFPESICRWQQGACHDATLFSMVMDLNRVEAHLIIGKQCQVDEETILKFS